MKGQDDMPRETETTETEPAPFEEGGFRAPHDLDPDAYLKDCVTIEPLAIQEEYVRIPADMAFWGQRFADTQKAFQLAEQEKKRVRAALYILHRERLTNEGKVTEGMIDAHVETDEDYQAVVANLITAEWAMAKTKAARDAVGTKKDMLVSLGAHVRQEMEGDPVIRSQHTDYNRRRRNGA